MANDPHNIEGFSDYHKDSFNSLVERLENATQHLFRRSEYKWERDNSSAAWRSEWLAARGDHWRGRAIVRQTENGYQAGVVLYELGHDATVHWSAVKPELEAARTEAKDALKGWLSSRDKELTGYDQSYRMHMLQVGKYPAVSEGMELEGKVHNAVENAYEAMLSRKHGPVEKWPELERRAAAATQAVQKAFTAEREYVERERKDARAHDREMGRDR